MLKFHGRLLIISLVVIILILFRINSSHYELQVRQSIDELNPLPLTQNIIELFQGTFLNQHIRTTFKILKVLIIGLLCGI
jgi:hypothetical protein